MATLADETYDRIRNMILAGELKAGLAIQENGLAKKLNVSRTPVREAIGRLITEGLITRYAGQTPTVQTVSLTDYIEILHMRRLLEGEAAALAAKSSDKSRLEPIAVRNQQMIEAGELGTDEYVALDEELHLTIAELSGSRLLAQNIKDLRLKTRIFDLGGVTKRLVPSGQEHVDILDAIHNGDSEMARQKMAAHIEQVRRSILEELGNLFDN
ncbi:DNA-binding GntR family transcriptional regulator [Maritalea mobilis]|uniref:DNA-binding GntR family transcriptional regulator n=1 Tax=Maritalea mobilis TaxID=483324 RepID=A0A4R6VW95_9HYPH|nr:GntR family transcriptional regulator [Maritalea mobilis]TDQ67077.1 DNA-binding GntR family transcriptional regulator [Maritalea mobilis]